MRVTAEHWKRFLEIASENPQLITSEFCGSNGKAKLNALWQSAVNSLDSLGYGQKSVAEWRKAVTDWKSKTKNKASKIKREQSKTGGGTINIAPLNKLEEQLLNLMGKKAVVSDEEVVELGLKSQQVLETHTSEDLGCTSQNENVSEHTYSETTVDGGSKAKKVGHTKDIPNKRRKRRHPISNDIINLTKDTYIVLKSIDANLKRLADSAENISNTLNTYFRV